MLCVNGRQFVEQSRLGAMGYAESGVANRTDEGDHASRDR